jgi:hypothetical protein
MLRFEEFFRRAVAPCQKFRRFHEIFECPLNRLVVIYDSNYLGTVVACHGVSLPEAVGENNYTLVVWNSTLVTWQLTTGGVLRRSLVFVGEEVD